LRIISRDRVQMEWRYRMLWRHAGKNDDDATWLRHHTAGRWRVERSLAVWLVTWSLAPVPSDRV